MSDVFDSVVGQPRVREFLRASIHSGRISHAYLFTGPAGSNKTTAAYAFAQAILCEEGGCDDCINCKQITRRVHPDVHYYAPEGAQGYLVEQIREIVGDASLSPIRASRKVYIIDRADLMGVSAANAFLKTLEEPPDDVVIILLGRTRESVLPTIVSRCQVVAFRYIPATEAAAILSQHTTASLTEASIAIQACGGSITKATQFLKSHERMEFRRRVVEVLNSLALADDLDILNYAKELVNVSKNSLDEVRREQEEILLRNTDFLARSALKSLEAQQKRMLSQTSFEYLHQLMNIVRSWLRDVMIVAVGTPELLVNKDFEHEIGSSAGRTDEVRVCRALVCVDTADDAITYNVSPQTCIEAMLFEIREVLYGTGRTC